MAVEASTRTSMQPSQRSALQEITWEQIEEPGAYVELGSGDLYRIPQEAIGPNSPVVRKQSLGASRLAKVSSNPFVTTLEAKMICAEHNINPNF